MLSFPSVILFCIWKKKKPPLCNVDLSYSLPVFRILFVLFYHTHKNQLLTDQDQGKKWSEMKNHKC